MADKEGMERKVYLLPTELVERIKAYQVSQNIGSEVEAARRLLDAALQMRDDAPSLLRQLRARFAEERDLRVLARDILINHVLVRGVMLQDDGSLNFRLASDDWGRIERDGRTYIGNGREDDWETYPKPKPPTPRAAGAAPTWEPNKGSDLDDDIPF